MPTERLSDPLVTIAIPLYMSQQFVDRIAANVAAIDYPNTEIVISDRHCADDAIERLKTRLANDHRVRFATATDGCGWVEHYNVLLREASGQYFMWMPHDDEFHAGYVSTLVARLEAEPEALLAYGGLEAVDLDGRPVRMTSVAHELTKPWSPRSAAELLMSWQAAIPFRGVFRREVALRSGLWLPRAPASDQCWLFSLILLGPIRFEPAVTCRKTVHPSSTTETSPRRISDMLQTARAMRSSVSTYVRDPDTARYLSRFVSLWCLWAGVLDIGARVGRWMGIPRNTRARVRLFLQRG